MPLGLTLRKSRLLTSFSFSRSNRIGSDDKINAVSSNGDKCESIKRSSLERLRNELEVKDRTITELRKQLDGLSSHEIAFSMPKTPYQPGRRLNRLRLSGLTRSASIISSTNGYIVAMTNYSWSMDKGVELVKPSPIGGRFQC